MKSALSYFSIIFALAIAFALPQIGFAENHGHAHHHRKNLPISVDESRIGWEGSKLGGRHHGTVRIKEGHLLVNEREKRRLAGGEFVFDMNSIAVEDLTNPTENQELVAHLKSDDFFDVENHPEAKFVITSVEYTSDSAAKITGNLTMRGQTHPVRLDASIDENKEGIEAQSEVEINRTQWGVNHMSRSVYKKLRDNFVRDGIKLNIKVSAKK